MTEHEHEAFESPGQLLRTAREHRGFSQAEVAKKLRLSIQKIDDIENDMYDHYVALIYIRGYVQMYANYFRESEFAARVMQAFDALDIKINADTSSTLSPYALSHSTMLDKALSAKPRHGLRWLSFGISILLIGLLYLWWQQQTSTSVMTPHAQPSPVVHKMPVAKPEVAAVQSKPKPKPMPKPQSALKLAPKPQVVAKPKPVVAAGSSPVTAAEKQLPEPTKPLKPNYQLSPIPATDKH